MAIWPWLHLTIVYSAAVASALTYSRVMRAMFEIGISFGHTASHSPSFDENGRYGN